MTVSAPGLRCRAIGLLAGGLVLALAMPAQAQRERVIGWAPSRDEAVVVDEAEAIGSGVRQAAEFVEEIQTPARRLSAPRPSRLQPRGSVGPPPEEFVEGLPTIVHPSDPTCQSCCGADCGQCVDCCGNWNSCGPVPICVLLPRPCMDDFELHAGVHGFTGPLNRSVSGSFGFHEGFNWGIPLCHGDAGCGQIGALWTQSNYSGSLLVPDERNQIFMTAGLFRRVDWGLQCGLAFDYLHDEWDYEIDLGQLRGELGWRYCGCHEIGIRFSTGVNDDSGQFNVLVEDDGQFEIESTGDRVVVNDLCALYYRRQFACGGEGRLFGGCTNNEQGLVGGDVRLPMNACWSLVADFLYVVPAEDSNEPGFAEETWNVSVGVVWTPFAKPGCPNYCRPLFDVANNGTFATRLE